VRRERATASGGPEDEIPRLTLDGVLVVDKPAGPTSHDVVAVVRRTLDVDRVGHTGTLDPLATGVLPLVLGRATRLATFMSDAEKEYVARVRFGAATASYDAEGLETSAPREGRAVPADAREIAAVLPRFSGSYRQQPPQYSAKKIAGTPAYKLARRNAPVAIAPVEVSVHALELLAYADGAADVRIVCSSGFYVRSFAHDLGQAIGCGAHLETLRRTRAGTFTLRDAVALDRVIANDQQVRSRVVPLERLLPDMPEAHLTEPGVRRASHGNPLIGGDFRLTGGSSAVTVGTRLRLIDPAGKLLGIGNVTAGGLLHPSVVLV
jgi:tRNA pseudouridine55 synthase